MSKPEKTPTKLIKKKDLLKELEEKKNMKEKKEKKEETNEE